MGGYGCNHVVCLFLLPSKASHSFIILQHATVPKHTWCLRIKDPLSDIHSAYLMLDLVCDTSLTIRDTGNFFRLSLTRRVYASTCEDDMESDVCRSMSNSNLCKVSSSSTPLLTPCLFVLFSCLNNNTADRLTDKMAVNKTLWVS